MFLPVPILNAKFKHYQFWNFDNNNETDRKSILNLFYNSITKTIFIMLMSYFHERLPFEQ